MRNNTRALIFHILIVFITFAVASLINLSSQVRDLVYGNIAFKVILVGFIVILYFNFGKGLSKKNARSFDLGLGREVFSSSVGGSYWKFPLEFFLMPQVYAIKILGISYNPLSLFVASLIPGFIYGMSIKISRSRIIRRNRAKMRRR